MLAHYVKENWQQETIFVETDILERHDLFSSVEQKADQVAEDELKLRSQSYSEAASNLGLENYEKITSSDEFRAEIKNMFELGVVPADLSKAISTWTALDAFWIQKHVGSKIYAFVDSSMKRWNLTPICNF